MKIYLTLALLLLASLMSACGRNMYDQPKYRVFDASSLLPNGASTQPLQANTVPRTIAASDNRYADTSFYSGLGATGFVSEFPLELTTDLIERGQNRYNIYCSPCHNYSGDGMGMVVQKGFPHPTSFHDPRLRSAEVGYFVNAMTNGFGRMFSYASRIAPEDRWAIAAYIKTLQYSQYALPEDAASSAASGTEGESH
ncbi:MAG: cytochrome c [Deinococcales bacterium]